MNRARSLNRIQIRYQFPDLKRFKTSAINPSEKATNLPACQRLVFNYIWIFNTETP